MKKYALGILVFGLFSLYVLSQKKTPSTPSQASTQQTQSLNASPTSIQTTSVNTVTTFKNGTYTGKVADAIYGPMQVKITVTGNKLTDIEYLQYPNDRRETIEINQNAMPILKSEAIKVQSAHVDVVTGATQSSQGFQETLQDALNQASA